MERESRTLAGLLDSQDEWVRLEAAVALAMLGDARGVPMLEAALSSWDTDRALMAAGALAELREQGEPVLLRALDDPAQPPPMREAIIGALAEIPTAGAYAAVERALNDRNRFVRRQAKRSLRRRG
jgi:HEAT repeat protein